MASARPGAGGKKFKVVLLGESGVGKSSLVLRLVKDEWVDSQHSTVGASFFRYSTNVDEQPVNFDIWDTAGQERYKSLASMYYRGAAAALVVYDITSYDSFDRAKYWVRELTSNSPDTIITIVGNKSDLEAQRKVTADEAKAYAAELNAIQCEASAKEGSNVQNIFQQIAKKLQSTPGAAPVAQGGVVGRDPRGRRPGEGGSGKKDGCNC